MTQLSMESWERHEARGNRQQPADGLGEVGNTVTECEVLHESRHRLARVRLLTVTARESCHLCRRARAAGTETEAEASTNRTGATTSTSIATEAIAIAAAIAAAITAAAVASATAAIVVAAAVAKTLLDLAPQLGHEVCRHATHDVQKRLPTDRRAS